MSKFSAMTRNELHLFSLILQVGALTDCLTVGGESDTTEQSAPVKPPDTDRIVIRPHRNSRHMRPVTIVNPAKTAKPIEMQSAMLSRMAY